MRGEWGVEGYSLSPEALEPRPAVAGASGRAATIEEIEASCSGCTLCPLHAGRTQIVFGVGDPRAKVVFVGEGPGREEDIQGEPFVGRAGKLLTDMIRAMGFARSDVYICNAVKCRPPGNRTPAPDEIATCRPYLEAQMAAIRPRVIVALGNPAVRALFDITKGITHLRGTFNPKAKGPVWEDLKRVLAEIGRTPPARPRR